MIMNYNECLPIVDKMLTITGKFHGTRQDMHKVSDYFKLHNWRIDGMNFKIAYGATKAVIIFDDCDFVVKVPLLDSCDHINYPALEYANYCALVDDGLGDFVAWMAPIGRVCGVPLYAQEKVDCDVDKAENDAIHLSYDRWKERGCIHDIEFYDYEDDKWRQTDDVYDFSKEADRSDYFYNCVIDGQDIEWEMLQPVFACHYGAGQAEKLDAKLDYYGINDIHAGNVGYRNGGIVLLDYSGYYRKDNLKDSEYAIFKLNKAKSYA